jgi:hypothetical protein
MLRGCLLVLPAQAANEAVDVATPRRVVQDDCLSMGEWPEVLGQLVGRGKASAPDEYRDDGNFSRERSTNLQAHEIVLALQSFHARGSDPRRANEAQDGIGPTQSAVELNGEVFARIDRCDVLKHVPGA